MTLREGSSRFPARPWPGFDGPEAERRLARGLANGLRAAAIALGIATAGGAAESRADVLRAGPGEFADRSAEGAIVAAFDALRRHAVRTSGNHLRIEFGTSATRHPRGTLGQIDARQLDIAPIDMALYSETFSYSLVIPELTFVIAEPAVVAGAATEFFILHCRPCFEEFRKAGVLPLAMIGQPATYLVSQTRISALDELAGKRIRASEPYVRWAARMGALIAAGGAEGAQGTIITLAEAVAAHRRGPAQSRATAAVPPHVTDLAIGTAGPVVLFGLSKAAWDGLGLGDRAALISAAPHALASGVRAAAAADTAARAELGRQSASFHPPHAAFAARHTTIRTESLSSVNAQAERRGVLTPNDLIDRYMILIRRWAGLITPLGANLDGIEEVFFQEIYSKINPRGTDN